jgi:hypothetical protein
MKRVVFFVGLMLIIGRAVVLGQIGGPMIIDPENNGVDMDGKSSNYQDEILSNPQMNSAARVGVTVGNKAVINQNGSDNSSSISQSGDNNWAEQTQYGNRNDIYLKQNGKNNRHRETQTGNFNRKVIIQNDSETIIEQVTP